MRTNNLQNISLGFVSIITIIVVGIVLIMSLTEFGNFGIAQGQLSNSTSSSSASLTPQQKKAICDPTNPKLKVANTTESKICDIPPTSAQTNMTTTTRAPQPTPPANTTTTADTPIMDKLSPSLYEQGYTKGITDAKSVQPTIPPNGTMSTGAVFCDSEIDPHMSNHDYCSGYQHGYADTYNKKLSSK